MDMVYYTGDNSENNFANDSNCELISTIEIVDHKIEPIGDEDNVMVELATQVTIVKSETSESEETVVSTSHNLTQFVDCRETIKEEMKEEVEEEYQRDPLRLSNAVQSLDEPVTYEEFICEG